MQKDSGQHVKEKSIKLKFYAWGKYLSNQNKGIQDFFYHKLMKDFISGRKKHSKNYERKFSKQKENDNPWKYGYTQRNEEHQNESNLSKYTLLFIFVT